MEASCTPGGEEANVSWAWWDEHPGGATRVNRGAAKAKRNGASGEWRAIVFEAAVGGLERIGSLLLFAHRA